MLEQAGQEPAARFVLSGQGVGVLELAEDLRLTEYHGVQPRRDARLADQGARLLLPVLPIGGDDVPDALRGEQAELDLPRTTWTHCPDWAKGVGHSLRHGLEVLGEGEADAALVHLVDLPDVTAVVAQRLLGGEVGRGSLRRAVYAGAPGHPVLIGRDHWGPLVAELAGDSGAGDYLRRHGAERVECSDLATGRDVDRPQP